MSLHCEDRRLYDLDSEDCFDFENVDEKVQREEDDAKKSLRRFFSDKKLWCGGNIPANMLLSEKHLNTLLDTTIEIGASIAHYSLQREAPEHFDTSDSSWCFRLINTILAECGTRGISKSYAGGIVLLYLELCEGVQCLKKLDLFRFRKDEFLATLDDMDRYSDEVVDAHIIDNYFIDGSYDDVVEETEC